MSTPVPTISPTPWDERPLGGGDTTIGDMIRAAQRLFGPAGAGVVRDPMAVMKPSAESSGMVAARPPSSSVTGQEAPKATGLDQMASDLPGGGWNQEAANESGYRGITPEGATQLPPDAFADVTSGQGTVKQYAPGVNYSEGHGGTRGRDWLENPGRAWAGAKDGWTNADGAPVASPPPPTTHHVSRLDEMGPIMPGSEHEYSFSGSGSQGDLEQRRRAQAEANVMEMLQAGPFAEEREKERLDEKLDAAHGAREMELGKQRGEYGIKAEEARAGTANQNASQLRKSYIDDAAKIRSRYEGLISRATAAPDSPNKAAVLGHIEAQQDKELEDLDRAYGFSGRLSAASIYKRD